MENNKEKFSHPDLDYREIFDKANDAIIIHDIATGKLVDVNKRICDLLGYSFEEMLKLNVGDFSSGVHPYSQEEATNWMKKAVLEGPQIFEWQGKNCKGQIFWTEVHLKKVTLGDQERILGIVREITDRKNYENILKQEKAKAEQYFQIAGTILVVLDNKGEVIVRVVAEPQT